MFVIVAVFEGMFGCKIKGSGLIGVMGDMLNMLLGILYVGGKYILDWIVYGDVNAIRVGIVTGVVAFTWEDAEFIGYVVNFVCGLCVVVGSVNVL